MLLLGSPWQPCSIAFARASRRAISTSNSLPTASFISRTTRMTPSLTEEAAAASAGITMLSWQDEHRGMSAAQLLDVVERLAELADQPLLPRLGPVPRLERLAQLQQVPAQLELRLDLPLQGLQGRLLARGQRPRHPVDDAQRPEGVPVGRDEGRARVEPDVRRRRPRAGCRGSARRRWASGTTKSSRCWMAWAQKAMLREVSRAETPTRALNHCRSASTRLMSAIGVPQISEASSARSSNAFSGSVSRIRYRRRASSRAFS